MDNKRKVRNQALIVGAALPVIVIILIESGASPWLIGIAVFVATARLAVLFRRWSKA